jgi:hypothetical protein
VFILKKSFLESAGQFQSKLGINHAWVKEILDCSNEGPGLVQRGDNYKNGVRSLKNLLQNH